MNQSPNPEDFQCHQVIAWLREAGQVLQLSGDLPPEPIHCFLAEFCKIFNQMGRLLGFAFSDVVEKVAIMRERTKQAQATGVFALIKQEMQLKNNSKLSSDKTLKNFVSYGRSMLRMMRFMDYLKIMFSEITDDRTIRIPAACHKAYMTALYPHHTFLVQTAAKLAMQAAPDRPRILSLFIAKNGGELEAYQAMVEFVQVLEPVRVALWEFYQASGLTNLP